MDTHGITAIDIAGDIVTAIHIVDVATLNQHAGGIAGRIISAIDGLLINGCLGWVHIGHSASAKDVLNLQIIGVGRIDMQENTILIGHSSLITTAVKVTDDTLLQVPLRTDSHRGFVVAAKYTREIV